MKLNPKLLLDVMYPVGSYYETSDTSFNPNTAWGGTWVEDTKGRVTVALDSNDTDFNTIGKTGGSKYLQAHTHNAYRGLRLVTNQGETIAVQDFVQKSDQTYETTSTGTGNSGNLQPYAVVKRWHRTA